jgi:mono/diheme cytochrome c family protein
MKIFTRALGVVFVAFLFFQFVRPQIPAGPATAEIQAPPEIKHILEKDCYSCHSNERRLAWFDEVEPAYWLVRKDVLTARAHLNFSTIGAKPAAAQKGALYEAVNMIQLGAMPLPRFTAVHPEAKVTPDELATLKAYLNPWPAQASVATVEAKMNAGVPDATAQKVLPSLDSVQPELNGVPFDGAFEGWKLIGMTERGDNHTLRFILGNDVALKAVESGNFLPWPDGAKLAKIAWQQETGGDGLIHAGKFIQVELMIKDAQRWKSTDGWGWGRWRGLDLEPYGNDARFVMECTTCHLPVRADDAVYTQPITPTRVQRAEVVNNRAAALPAGLPYRPLAWGAITLYVDPREKTIAGLFGDDKAMRAARARETNGAGYPEGAVVALVTWAERDDPHWFGARIADAVRCVEFVTAGADGKTGTYRRFDADGTEENVGTGEAALRAKAILSLGVAELP